MHKYSSKQPDTSINVKQCTFISNLAPRLGIVGTTLCSEMFIILSDITPNRVSPMTHCEPHHAASIADAIFPQNDVLSNPM